MTDEIAEKVIALGFGKYFKPVSEEVIEEAKPNVVSSEPNEDLKLKEKEAEIKLDVYEKEDKPKNSLDTYSRARLVELCEKREYPKEEWKDLVRKDLIKYVNGK
jgi:hypothetical protein